MRRSWIAIGASGLLAVGVAATIATLARDGRSPSPGIATAAPDADADADAPVTRAEFEELRADLEFERQARSAVAEEVASLRRALDEKRRTKPGAADGAPSSDQAAAAQTAEPDAGATVPAADSAGRPAFDARALVLAGLADADAERLRARWEAFELEKLELNDRGLREGWKGRRFRRERLALESALRRELGDEWDAYLFATGRQNRLRVNNVLANSVASAGGFEEGDLILSYDHERIYHPYELQARTAGCADGAFVNVEVERNGELDTLRVPCGPLGVLVDHVKQPPRLP